MRILFAGSPAIAVPSLETVFREEGITLVGVLTNPDSPKGRKSEPLPTDIAEASLKLLKEGRTAFPILKPLKLDSQAREQVASLKPDLLVSFAYGRLFGPKFLALFPLGGINIHPSLLPKYRGPSPIQAAILNRDMVTGISVQRLAKEMDSGDILAAEQFQLTGRETAGSLSETVSVKAALILTEVLKKIADGTVKGKAQNHSDASYCPLVSKEDALIDWKKSAAEIDAKIRAFDTWPICRTIHNGLELLILKAEVFDNSKTGISGLVLGIDKQAGILVQTGEGILAVTELQYQGKKALFWRDFLNGARDFSGSQLG